MAENASFVFSLAVGLGKNVPHSKPIFTAGLKIVQFGPPAIGVGRPGFGLAIPFCRTHGLSNRQRRRAREDSRSRRTVSVMQSRPSSTSRSGGSTRAKKVIL